jgi:pimeloyl-ACP methyl ester carboxylesterase
MTHSTSAETRDNVLTLPDGYLVLTEHPVPGSRATVLFCHGLGGDREGPAGLFAQLASAANAAGCSAVRFDFRGAGESSGAFENTTMAGMVADVLSVVAWSTRTVPERAVIVAGHSVGGVVAAAVASRTPAEVAGALLLACDLGPYDYGIDDPVLFARDTARFPAAFAAERATLDLRDVPFSCPVRYIGGSLERDEILDTMRGLSLRAVPVTTIENGDHLFSRHRQDMARSTAQELTILTRSIT